MFMEFNFFKRKIANKKAKVSVKPFQRLVGVQWGKAPWSHSAECETFSHPALRRGSIELNN